MDLSSVDDLEFFDQIARSQSLTEAARVWGKSVSAVSKRLAQLEARLGVPLVRRSTRRMTLTDEGQSYATGAMDILQRREDLEDEVTRQRGQLKGRIALHSTLGLGRTHIAPLLGEFVKENPLIRIDLELSPLPLNISGTSFDIAIRVGELADSRLKVKLLARNRRIICAADEYLAKGPRLESTSDLVHHDCIILRENQGDYALWRFGPDGKDYVRVNGNLAADDGDVVTGWCVQGLGLMMRSTWHVGPLIRSGSLRHVLPKVQTPSADIFALYAATTQTPHRISAVIEYLRDGLARRLENRDVL